MHILWCIFQGFGLAILIFGGFGAIVIGGITLTDRLQGRFGDWAPAITLGLFAFLVLGTILTLNCLGILH